MFGGDLYGDLPPPSDEQKSKSDVKPATGWATAAAKMAPILRRTSLPFAPPPAVLRAQGSANQSSVSPQVVSSSIRARPPSTAAAMPPPPSISGPPQPVPVALVGASAAVMEEYDPARPNNYEDFVQERRRKKLEEDVRREAERRRREEEEREERERLMAEQRESKPDRTTLGVSGEEAWRRRAGLAAGAASTAPPAGAVEQGRDSPPPPPKQQMSAAERMMAKMGWKSGEGLGKDRQGITTPLMAKKTDKRGGVIVNASARKEGAAAAAQPGPGPLARKPSLDAPATRVLLLRNMVGPGEVDGELEDEVASECTKYGQVTGVVIFEITDVSFPTSERVRVFVEFSRPEESTKGLVDMDGRFFGGRVVRASFYSEELYLTRQLGPQPGELPVDQP